MNQFTARAFGTTIAILLCAVSPIVAQDGLERAFSPVLGKLKYSISYETDATIDAGVHGRDGELDNVNHRLSAMIPIFNTTDFEWSVSPILEARDFCGTQPTLPDTGETFPDALYDVGFSTQARMRVSKDWIAGARLEVHSPSDKPFHSDDETAVRLTSFVRIPWKPAWSWIVMLDVSNTRQFAENIPLPGGALHYTPGEHLEALLGFPYSMVRWRPVKDLTLSASYFIPRDLSAKINYRLFGPVNVYAAFDWDSATYRRYDRLDDDDELVYHEKRLAVGTKIYLNECTYVDVSGGYGFDRHWYEADEYDDRDENRLKLEDGPFVKAVLGVRF